MKIELDSFREMSRIVAVYNAALLKHPVKTKMATQTCFAFLGDSAAQLLFERKEFDYHRNVRFMLIGTFITAPMNILWVDKIQPKILPMSKRNINVLAMKRVALGCLVYAPLIVTTVVGTNMFLSGKVAKEQILPKLAKEQPRTIVSSWIFWAPAQFINYRFVPAHWQIFYMQNASMIWTCFLSWLAHKNLDN